MKIYTAYDPPPKVTVSDFGPGRTRIEDADSCDINKIVARYKTTGVLPANNNAGIYADVTQMGDYRTAIDQVRTADELFMQLPSDVRAEFSNDPAVFLDFVSNPDNKQKLQDMGLIKGEETELEEPAQKDVSSSQVDS